MAYISIRDTEHYYEWITTADGDRTNKPVMLFVHGWGGSARYWQSTATALSQQFDCLLYDMRGFGRSRRQGSTPNRPLGNTTTAEALAPFDIQRYADDIVALLDEFGIERCWLQAHSMGTSIAALFLAQHPERVEKAILACGGIFVYRKLVFELFYFFGRYVVQFRPRWLTQIPLADWLFMQRFLHRPLAKPLRVEFLEDFLMADGGASLGTLQSAVSKQAADKMPGYFGQFTMPTLLISGAHDQIIPARLGVSAAVQNQDNIDHQIIPGTGHFPMLEDSATYLQQVQRFITPPTSTSTSTVANNDQDGNPVSADGDASPHTALSSC